MYEQIKRAVILAGGKGSRLHPYTVVLPKPLMPIGNYTILEVIVKQLSSHGFGHITLAVNHQAELIKSFFGDGSKWGVKIDYSLEEQALSTMAPLKLIGDLPKNYLVMNGDILTDLNYSEFYKTHIHSKSLFTISSYKREEKIDYGVLEVDKFGVLKNFCEKPIKSYEVSMGIYMMNKATLEDIPENTPYGFDDLMKGLLTTNKNINVKNFTGYWLDIGRPDDYAIAIDEFEKLNHIFIYD